MQLRHSPKKLANDKFSNRIYDRYKQKIVALAVITSPTKDTTPQDFHYNYFGTTLHYTYTTCKIFDYDETKLEQSDKLFSKIVLATQYMYKSKQDENKRYSFKMKLMREIIRDERYTRKAVQAMFYFIDYLLILPTGLSKELATSIRSILHEEESQMLQANREEPSPTLAEIFKLERTEGKIEGKREGKLEGIKHGKIQVAKKMLESDVSIEQIMMFTGLTEEEIRQIKEK